MYSKNHTRRPCLQSGHDHQAGSVSDSSGSCLDPRTLGVPWQGAVSTNVGAQPTLVHPLANHPPNNKQKPYQNGNASSGKLPARKGKKGEKPWDHMKPLAVEQPALTPNLENGSCPHPTTANPVPPPHPQSVTTQIPFSRPPTFSAVSFLGPDQGVSRGTQDHTFNTSAKPIHQSQHMYRRPQARVPLQQTPLHPQHNVLSPKASSASLRQARLPSFFSLPPRPPAIRMQTASDIRTYSSHPSVLHSTAKTINGGQPFYNPMSTGNQSYFDGSITQVGQVNPKYERYLTLMSAAVHNQKVYRVHTPTSVSPLVETTAMATSGFFAPSSAFTYITPASYGKMFDSQSGHPAAKDSRDIWWLTGPWMRSTMIDHLICRPTQPIGVRMPPPQVNRKGGVGHRPRGIHARAYTPQKVTGRGEIGTEKGCWLSTSKNLDWCIWDIARRLAQAHTSGNGDKLVHLAVVRSYQAPSSTPDPSFMADQSERGNGQIEEVRERTIVPYYVLADAERNILSEAKRAASMEARRRAQESFEVLYWGRIFGENVMEDLQWSADYLPFALPAKFWRPNPFSDTSVGTLFNGGLPGWLDRLRWDPRKDGWAVASRAMKVKHQPTTAWEDQPIHRLSSVWPPENGGDQFEMDSAESQALLSNLLLDLDTEGEEMEVEQLIDLLS